MSEPDGWEFRLSPDRRYFAFYDPGNGPWFVPKPDMQGRFVDSPDMDQLGWDRYTPAVQQPVDAICREIRRVQTMYDNALNVQGDAAFTARLQWGGEIIGLRKALCVLLGWPLEEAAHEGKADEYAQDWAGLVRPGEEPTP